jgi:hypothetical protein
MDIAFGGIAHLGKDRENYVRANNILAALRRIGIRVTFNILKIVEKPTGDAFLNSLLKSRLICTFGYNFRLGVCFGPPRELKVEH